MKEEEEEKRHILRVSKHRTILIKTFKSSICYLIYLTNPFFLFFFSCMKNERSCSFKWKKSKPINQLVEHFDRKTVHERSIRN